MGDEIALKTGLIVNWILILASIFIYAFHEFCCAPSKKMLSNIIRTTKEQLFNIGIAIYISAGSAFFGTLPFTKVQLNNHLLFCSSWGFFFLLVTVIQFCVVKVTGKSNSNGLTPFRISATITGILFSCWLWTGAKSFGYKVKIEKNLNSTTSEEIINQRVKLSNDKDKKK